MTADEAEDWLSVALGEVAGYSAELLREGCSAARRACTHHAQIIPAIIGYIEENTITASGVHYDEWIPSPPPPPLTEEEYERIVAEKGIALSAMIDRGLIISNGNGTFRRRP